MESMKEDDPLAPLKRSAELSAAELRLLSSKDIVAPKNTPKKPFAHAIADLSDDAVRRWAKGLYPNLWD